VVVLTSPIVFLALVPFLMVCVGAFIRPIVDRQALIMFVPYVLIVLAAGAREVAGRTALKAPLAICSRRYSRRRSGIFNGLPQTPRDYAALAEQINARMQPNDLIFVKPRLWYVTPFFYYVDQSRLVSERLRDTFGQARCSHLGDSVRERATGPGNVGGTH
jgi:hypothetical protein